MSSLDRLRSRMQDERGFSLPELLVSIALMSIVSAAIISSTVAVQRNLGVANATMNDLAANRIAVERVGHLLRGAIGRDGNLTEGISALDTSVLPTAQSVTFYTVTGQAPNANPLRVQLAVEGTDLVERIWQPTPALTTGVSPTYSQAPARRVILRDLVDPDPATPVVEVFRFWSHYYNTADADRCGRQVPLSGMTVEQMRTIDSISFRLVVNEPDGYVSAPSDLQGWARFASDQNLGFSTSFDSQNCLSSRGLGYDEVYTP